jgi:hypothetical protein
VTVAILALGLNKIVLAGVPLVADEAHYFDQRRWTEAERYKPHWDRYLHLMRNRVKSMSGWTRQLLGAPDADWINAER